MCIKMNFSKKVIVTNHAVERMMERRVDMTPRAWNAYKKSPKKYIGDMLKFKNIKRMERKADGVTEVYTRGRYVVRVKEYHDKNVVLTVFYQNREKESRKAR